jgi:hypothetical protein
MHYLPSAWRFSKLRSNEELHAYMLGWVWGLGGETRIHVSQESQFSPKQL